MITLIWAIAATVIAVAGIGFGLYVLWLLAESFKW